MLRTDIKHTSTRKVVPLREIHLLLVLSSLVSLHMLSVHLQLLFHAILRNEF